MHAITDREEIARAFQVFKRTISECGVPLESTVGWKSDSGKWELLWHEDLKLWVWLHSEDHPEQHFCGFGVDNPHETSQVSITCEINPSRMGSRNCAGFFVKHESEIVFLAHSGRVGGGRPGIGQVAFLKHWHGKNVATVEFPNGKEHDYIILGRISDSDCRAQLKTFVHSVAKFKKAVAGPD